MGQLRRIIHSLSLKSHYPVFEWRLDKKANYIKEKSLCVLTHCIGFPEKDDDMAVRLLYEVLDKMK